MIFHDSTSHAIAGESPSDLPVLGRISGVGIGKLDRYGQQVLDTLRAARATTATAVADRTAKLLHL